MPAYFIGQLQIDDPDIYAKYTEAAGPSFAAGNIKPLAVDDNFVQIEGEWPATRRIILEFEDEAAFRAWYDSDDYQAAKAIRMTGMRLNGVLVHGLSRNRKEPILRQSEDRNLKLRFGEHAA